MGGMDHTGTGMMSDADMTILGNVSGATFDRMWVSLMVQHHQGAVTIATTEQTSGQNADVKALAQSIIASRSAHITQLTRASREVAQVAGLRSAPAHPRRCGAGAQYAASAGSAGSAADGSQSCGRRSSKLGPARRTP